MAKYFHCHEGTRRCAKLSLNLNQQSIHFTLGSGAAVLHVYGRPRRGARRCKCLLWILRIFKNYDIFGLLWLL